MVTKELSETAVELNAILDNCSDEVLSKIPAKFKEFLKKIESSTYKFNYDNNKSLNEQKIKPKTRRLLALIYSDYLCTINEKEAYLKECKQFLEEDNRLKYEKYAPDNIFKKESKKIEKISNNTLVVEQEKNIQNAIAVKKEKDTFIRKIIKFLRRYYG